MNVNKYLRRIGIRKFPAPDIRSLRKLHKNHLYKIPFENLDIHRKTPIVLNQSNLTKKIIDGPRGGYCYELNGMFYNLLKKLGFEAKLISARVSNGKGGWGEEFDHAAIIVKTRSEWLVDVGFGNNFILPLKMKLDVVQKDKNGFYKIVKHDNKYLKLMSSKNGKQFEDSYLFSLEKRRWKDFEGMNNYHQTSPESHFTKGKVCTIAFENGRITLSDKKLTRTNQNLKRSRKLKEGEFEKLLLRYFNIR